MASKGTPWRKPWSEDWLEFEYVRSNCDEPNSIDGERL